MFVLFVLLVVQAWVVFLFRLELIGNCFGLERESVLSFSATGGVAPVVSVDVAEADCAARI